MFTTSLMGLALAGEPSFPDSDAKELGVTAGYWTQGLARPGFRVAAYQSLGTSDRQRSSLLNGKEYTVTRDFLVAGGLGTFYHPGNELFVLANVEAGIWRDGRKRRHRESLVGLGYGRDFNAGPTYVLGSDGDLTRVPLDGRRSVVVSMSYGVGGRMDKDQVWYVRPTLLLRVPYASSIGTTFVLEIGTTGGVKR